jgi:peptide/nickel transport system ATP-binding protein
MMAQYAVMNVLEIKNLTVHFRTDQGLVEAIDRCDLILRKGEIMGLVGESGCGKTTMGRAILRVLPDATGSVVSGTILFDGEDLFALGEKEMNGKVRGRAITLIPQDPYSSFNPVFTIGTQFGDLVRQKAGAGEGETGKSIRDRIIDLLKMVQIPSPDQQLRKYPHEFSGGQRQRVMIAMALATRPSLIIADEPTTALDVTIEAQVLLLLRTLTKELQTSVLFITHDLGVADEICDRITVMYAGQIMESAPTESFFRRPCHPYTHGLLGSLPNPTGKIQTIKGDLPVLIYPPRGCRFHTRCPRATDECAQRRPEPREIDRDHVVRCFRPLTA